MAYTPARLATLVSKTILSLRSAAQQCQHPASSPGNTNDVLSDHNLPGTRFEAWQIQKIRLAAQGHVKAAA